MIRRQHHDRNTLIGLFFFLIIRRPPRSTLFPSTPALPISIIAATASPRETSATHGSARRPSSRTRTAVALARSSRSEEHTSELQSRSDLVCRLLLEKKKITATNERSTDRVLTGVV